MNKSQRQPPLYRSVFTPNTIDYQLDDDYHQVEQKNRIASRVIRALMDRVILKELEYDSTGKSESYYILYIILDLIELLTN